MLEPSRHLDANYDKAWLLNKNIRAMSNRDDDYVLPEKFKLMMATLAENARAGRQVEARRSRYLSCHQFDGAGEDTRFSQSDTCGWVQFGGRGHVGQRAIGSRLCTVVAVGLTCYRSGTKPDRSYEPIITGGNPRLPQFC